MALITMLVNDTPENERAALTSAMLTRFESLDRLRHRLLIVDNGSTDERTIALLHSVDAEVMTLPINLGVAGALNLAWSRRLPDEVCIKVDNDIELPRADWADTLESVLKARPILGIAGGIPAGQPVHDGHTLWVWDEHLCPCWVGAVMATVLGGCLAAGPELIATIGGFDIFPDIKYGYEDVLYSHRARLAGFLPSWIPQVTVYHADPGGPAAYRAFKRDAVDRGLAHFNARVQLYESGEWPLKQPL